MNTVLAPIDFSPVSSRVIEKAIALARATDARLVLLYVVPPDVTEQEAAVKLAALQRTLRNDGVTAHAVHICGAPAECIIEQAERLTANYIVIGSHGHSAVYDLLVGSTTTGVLQRATCAVVTIPPGIRNEPTGVVCSSERENLAHVSR
jgi:nucleotide-binding universal stress UspA family protein